MPKIDEFIPKYDVIEYHYICIKASPDATLKAVEDIRGSEISPLVFKMLSLRELPGRLLNRKYRSVSQDGTLLSDLQRRGFCLLAKTENEIVIGLIGQFWKLTNPESVHINDPEAFLEFKSNRYSKAVMNFLVQIKDGHTLLSTETRVYTPDATARRKFKIYWRFISFGSAWIRILLLKAIKRKAEMNQG